MKSSVISNRGEAGTEDFEFLFSLAGQRLIGNFSGMLRLTSSRPNASFRGMNVVVRNGITQIVHRVARLRKQFESKLQSRSTGGIDSSGIFTQSPGGEFSAETGLSPNSVSDFF